MAPKVNGGNAGSAAALVQKKKMQQQSNNSNSNSTHASPAPSFITSVKKNSVAAPVSTPAANPAPPPVPTFTDDELFSLDGPIFSSKNATLKSDLLPRFSAVVAKSPLDIFLSTPILTSNDPEIFASLSSFLKLAFEPFSKPLFTTFLSLTSDKKQSTHAFNACNAFLLHSAAEPTIDTNYLVPIISTISSSSKWNCKVAALKLLSTLSNSFPLIIQKSLTTLIPLLQDAMCDSKLEVQKVACVTFLDVCKTVDNPDIDGFYGDLKDCISDPKLVPVAIGKLCGIRFVTTVRAGTLAVLTPLLQRGLAERSHTILRATCVVIDNMCKLVEDPTDATHFLPVLLPGVERIIETAGPPELRAIAEAARNTLLHIKELPPPTVADITVGLSKMNIMELNELIFNELIEALTTVHNVDLEVDEKTSEIYNTIFSQITDILSRLITDANFHATAWALATAPLSIIKNIPGGQDTVKSITKHLRTHFHKKDRVARGLPELEESGFDSTESLEVDDEFGEEICNCDFSLAYGSRILLNQTNLTLRRGGRYGILGRNGAGKTTLMRAISNGQLDGFPPPEKLRTLFVEHDLQASEVEIPVCEYLVQFVLNKDTKEEKDAEAKRVLKDVGFSDELMQRFVGNLSGGWKMKLGLARAVLYNADILLLDEPTNHLDVQNVQWLMDYLCSLKSVTSLIVSHDSGFLDTVCTHILHYDNKKIKLYRGNLSSFKEQNPSAQFETLYSLSANTANRMTFPVPMPLSGVKSKTRPVLKMTGVSFGYAGETGKMTLENVTVGLALSSRVACIGANGAGKSTLIKLLNGELLPTFGTVWKHPSLRIAYVAQHAFHHLEQHMEKSPNEYIQWRYATGIDRELAAKSTRMVSSSESAKMARTLKASNGEERQIECITGRRKKGKGLEYETKFVGMDAKWNLWIDRERLIELGFEKMVIAFDDFEAARTGYSTRALTTTECAKVLDDMGLEEQFAVHTKIKSLSAGQKVKVVLAAGMWNNPHMLVFDEPTNYLDRDALAGLAEAMEKFEGAVVLVSHNEEFVNKVCPETWRVGGGKVVVEGKTAIPKLVKELTAEDEEGFSSVVSENSVESAGNYKGVPEGPNEEDEDKKLEAKAQARLATKKKRSRKEEKAREVARRQAWLAGKKLSDDSDEEWTPFKSKEKKEPTIPGIVSFKK
ncbi:hypothetical protein HK098_000503 [Nowakowskiella sp. JEL0407]|nr:hypothetical protein HK098_000503 [Nowakowskiella sp. JEL0407]